MKHLITLAAAAALAGCAHGGIKTKTELAKGAAPLQASTAQVCMLAGSLPAEYHFTELARIKATKGTYGGVDEVTRAMAGEARRIGADAIINMQASQRFKSPLPWRYNAPTGDGEAVKLSADAPPLDCVAAGGQLG